MKTLLKLVSVLFLLVTWINAQVTIIHCGVLIDGNSEELSKNVSIVIKNAIIIDISNGLKDPTRDDSLIDLSNYTVLPGLMDMHTHLSGESNPKRYMERFTMDLDDYAYRSIQFAERTLMAGFTTVRLSLIHI